MNKGIMGILKFVLSREIEGMNFCKEKVNSVKDKSVKEVFEQLSEMEDGHVTYINKLIESVSKEEPISKVEPPTQNVEFFKRREEKEIVRGKVDDMASDLSVLRMTYLIEDDFINSFQRRLRRPHGGDEFENIFALL